MSHLAKVRVLKAVHDRDGHRCLDCGMTEEQHLLQFGRKLDTHRVIPGSRYTIEGCRTYCLQCHSRKAKRGARSGSPIIPDRPAPLPGAETFGQRLIRLRGAAGLSQSQLAARVGIPLGTLRNWEQGHRMPLLPVALRVARALGVSADELWTNEMGVGPRNKKTPPGPVSPGRRLSRPDKA
jgi:DNA-binding XRE family transcriptional regulator